MSNPVEKIIDELKEAQEDLEDAYRGKTKISARRARKNLMNIKNLAHRARKDLLAIRKGEKESEDIELPDFFKED